MYKSITRKLLENVGFWNSPLKIQITDGGSWNLQSNKGPRGFCRSDLRPHSERHWSRLYTPRRRNGFWPVCCYTDSTRHSADVHSNKYLLNYLFKACNTYFLNYLMHSINICGITYLIMFLMSISFYSLQNILDALSWVPNLCIQIWPPSNARISSLNTLLDISDI